MPGYLRALHGRRVTRFGTFNGWPDRKFATAFLSPPRNDGPLRVAGGLTDLALYWSWDASEIAIIDTPLLVQEQPDRRPTIAIGPADINRLIEIDEHACALQELAFWLTVPGWRAWQDFDVAADGSRIVTDAPPWQLPVHVYEEPASGPWMDWGREIRYSPAFFGLRFSADCRAIVNGQIVERWLEFDHDSVAACADARMERGLPVAPRLTVLGYKCDRRDHDCPGVAEPRSLFCSQCTESLYEVLREGTVTSEHTD